jgi:hypothetical protein
MQSNIYRILARTLLVLSGLAFLGLIVCALTGGPVAGFTCTGWAVAGTHAATLGILVVVIPKEDDPKPPPPPRPGDNVGGG